MTAMPFINSIGRSQHTLCGDDPKEKRLRIDALRDEVTQGERLKILTESEGWKAIQKRHDTKIKELQNTLEHAWPKEIKMIQSQIRVLREVSGIEKELAAAEAAGKELMALVEGEDE